MSMRANTDFDQVLHNLKVVRGDTSTVRAKSITTITKPSIQTNSLVSSDVPSGNVSTHSTPAVAKPSDSGDTDEPVRLPCAIHKNPGRRRVPKLVSACGIPMLRWGKYQSPNVSRIIRYKIKSRERVFRQRLTLPEQLDMARLEDTWDEILQKRHGVGSESQDPTWSHVWQTAITWTNQRIWQMTKTNSDRAREMYAVVQREAALAKEENVQWKRERRMRREARIECQDHLLKE